MQSTQSLPNLKTASHPLAKRIPRLAHQEAGELARTELKRFVSLIESLEGAAWDQATMCTAWNVRDILAHQAGAYASGASFAEFRRQAMQNPYMKTAKMPVDGINRRQIEDREAATTEALLDELRAAGPKAIANRQKMPWLLRSIPMSFGPPLGNAPLGYLTDNIYTRDTWMHRCDICVATGGEMVLTPEHDGRITALVVRDLEKILRPFTHSSGFVLELAGTAGGAWQFGEAAPTATLKMDALDFHILASDRRPAGELVQSGRVTISGDTDLGFRLLERFSVPY